MKARELRELSDNELRQRLSELTAGLYSSRVQRTTGVEENVNRVKSTRHDIARLKTILRERELTATKEAK
ncbi:MAG: 50S ribosomal protein L29 [Candidatus Hydrogenedentes bacterium]|nr:50S ribosomal protein L29 [Candidatus Hydrogenedentota bacterium]